MTFKLWFDEFILPSCVPLLDGCAVAMGPSAELAGVEEAEAFICPGNVIYNGERMDKAPKLKVIARLGVGYDNIDVPAATARNIVVVYAPQAPTVSTAEHAVALMMETAKRLNEAEKAVRGHDWRGYLRRDNKGMELDGRTLGLVGMGRIGSRVAKVGLALGMKVVVCDPFVTPDRAAELGVTLVPSLEALLNEADVVSLHLPATTETRNLMNTERFAQMKPGAILINSARGALIEESALVDALRSGRLAGAGLDVFQQEPIPDDHPLLQFENVVLSPHIASRTGAGHHRIWETTIVQALQVLRGEKPPFMLNPEIWETRRR
jgi:D-3-phosphoglycerate dehydrogenase